MKKVLFILSSGKLSGGEKVALDIANGLKNDFEFIFYLPEKPQNELLESLKDFKIYFTENKNIFKISKNLKQVIGNEKPNIIVCHGTRGAIYLKVVLLFSKKTFKFIYVLHGLHFFFRKFPFNLILLIWEILTNKIFVDKLVCVGRDDYNLAKKLKLINSEKLILIENGINIEDLECIEKNFLRTRFGLYDKKILLTICRLHPQKDVRTLIQAINLLRNENLVLFIVGDGPDRKKLEKLVDNLNLQNKVKFLGFQREVKKILKDADIFILSTRWEGLPLVILEAWASKVPVIASNVHGIKSLIKNNEDGLLFKTGDEKDLANKIKILIEDNRLRKKIIEAAFFRVKNEFNLNRMIEKYKNLFNG
jgi:glycosyltransferase involved in cell wall biosynthesis